MVYAPSAPSPALRAVAVTPNDDDDLVHITSGLWIGATGDVTVIPANNADDAPITFASVPAGTLLPLSVRRVLDTGTDASAIVAFW